MDGRLNGRIKPSRPSNDQKRQENRYYGGILIYMGGGGVTSVFGSGVAATEQPFRQLSGLACQRFAPPQPTLPPVGSVSTTSRNGAPSRNACVAKGQKTKGSNE